MSHILFVVLISAGAVALLAAGYSITWFFRGRHMQTDVGGNDEMRKRGLKCTSQQIFEHEAALRGESAPCRSADCGACHTPTAARAKCAAENRPV